MPDLNEFVLNVSGDDNGWHKSNKQKIQDQLQVEELK
jgi:hypothetical protein